MVSSGTGKNTIPAVDTTALGFIYAQTRLESAVTRTRSFYIASNQFDVNNAYCDGMNDNDTSVVESVVDFTEMQRINCIVCNAWR